MIHEQTLNCLKSFCFTLVKRSSDDIGILLNSKKLVIPWIMKSSNFLKSSSVWYSRNNSFHINYFKHPKGLRLPVEFKGQLISKKIVKPRILPKNERMNSFLLVCDVFSFVFWENPRPEKNVSRLSDL